MQSVSISVSGIATAVVADVGASSPLCTASSTGRTCTVSIEAPQGSDTIGVTLYDAASATGNVLGRGTSRFDVTGNGFSAPVSVSGSPGSLQLSAATTTFKGGVSASTPITVTALDADGNVITGAYAQPVALTVSDPSVFSLEPTSVDASGQTVTLTYNGGAASSATIGASASGVSASSVETVTVAVTTVPGPLSLATTALQFDAIGVTSKPIAISGNAAANFAAMTATSSNTGVATVALSSSGTSLTVTSTGVGSATVTVVPSDGSATAATLAVQVQTTVVEPQNRRAAR